MLRITITDTETNETYMDEEAFCICAGIALGNDRAWSCVVAQKDGTSMLNVAQSLDAAERAVKHELSKNPSLKIAYLAAKIARGEKSNDQH